MKLLFVHSIKIKEDVKGMYYTTASYSQDVWDRYLSLFNSLSIIVKKEQTIYNTDYARDKFEHLNIEKINLIEIPDLSSTTGSFFNISKLKSTYHIIENAVLKHDCIIVRLPSIVGNIAIKYAEKYNKPFLIEMVGCPWDTLRNHSFKGKLIAPLMWSVTRKKISNAPYVLYVTNEFLQQRYPCKGNSIGCSDVLLTPVDKSVVEKRSNKIQNLMVDSTIVLGTAGAVNVRYKGQEYVIEAISRLNKQGFNFEYHLIGGGDESYLKSIAKKHGVMDKVMFWGSVSHDKVFEYLDNLDIYIQPSKTEGLPRALIEAMSRGCPVLGSDSGGIPELIDKEFIFRSGSVTEICTLLDKMVKGGMVKEGERSFKKAIEFDKDILNKKRSSFYKDFINSAKCKIINDSK